jgi:hypothetical protein
MVLREIAWCFSLARVVVTADNNLSIHVEEQTCPNLK